MKASINQALKRLPAAPTQKYPQGAPFVTMMAGGTMSVEVFAPKGEDIQQPHTQDELYFIHSGKGEIVINGQRFDAAAGDAFFVAAGAEHRFENFSEDFVTWVVFYGPQGGE
ncbi:MAG: cupin domain-containing protein [Burkholderiales bacterium]|nr:MAG: cupin domain-containing protein [Burkholderiales bacterium]